MTSTPFVCPVCNGRGLVPNGFYRAIGGQGWSSSSLEPEKCRSCWGTGIVWGTCDNEFNWDFDNEEYKKIFPPDDGQFNYPPKDTTNGK